MSNRSVIITRDLRWPWKVIHGHLHDITIIILAQVERVLRHSAVVQRHCVVWCVSTLCRDDWRHVCAGDLQQFQFWLEPVDEAHWQRSSLLVDNSKNSLWIDLLAGSVDLRKNTLVLGLTKTEVETDLTNLALAESYRNTLPLPADDLQTTMNTSCTGQNRCSFTGWSQQQSLKRICTRRPTRYLALKIFVRPRGLDWTWPLTFSSGKWKWHRQLAVPWKTVHQSLDCLSFLIHIGPTLSLSVRHGQTDRQTQCNN